MNAPEGYTELDMVGFTDRGAYTSASVYVKNDIVHYGGNIWRCLIDDTQGVAPSESQSWTLFIGEPTNMVEQIIAPIEQETATAAHLVGDQLIYNDELYKVIVPIAAGDALVIGTNIKATRKLVYQLSAVEYIIANIEYTEEASQSYVPGEYILYNWMMYKVTEDIEGGDTIAPAQNVERVTIAGELKQIKRHLDDLGLSVVNGKLCVTYEKED